MSTLTVFNVAKERLTKDFEEIFREHYLLVYRTAYSVTGRSQDAAICEDCKTSRQVARSGRGDVKQAGIFTCKRKMSPFRLWGRCFSSMPKKQVLALR
jgi:hypothetical protein